MRCGIILPGGTAGDQLELAVLAEASGWDGVFVWECAYGVDAWSLLAAIAVRTRRVKVGTLLTPLPWRRPWKVASQVATVDQLSGGRAILSVGLGAIDDDLPGTGEVTALAERAARLDDGIDLVRALWSGATTYEGPHFTYHGEGAGELSEVVAPVQARIPLWVVGLWPRPRSLRRALRCDGIIPQYEGERTPAAARDLRRWLAEAGSPDIDVIAEGETPAHDASAARGVVAPWAEAGCTWWLETRWAMPHHSPERLAEVRERLRAGPPTP